MRFFKNSLKGLISPLASLWRFVIQQRTLISVILIGLFTSWLYDSSKKEQTQYKAFTAYSVIQFILLHRLFCIIIVTGIILLLIASYRAHLALIREQQPLSQSSQSPRSFSSSFNPKGESVEIAMLLSGDMAYTRAIEESFRATVKQAESFLHKTINIYPRVGPSDPINQVQTQERWKNEIGAIATREGRAPFNYYIGIGTQACQQWMQELGNKFGMKPFLFLGVTDPISIGLVKTLSHRHDRRLIAGVTYGEGAKEIAIMAHQIFPNRKLIYIYQEGFPQDHAIAQSLKTMPLYKNKILDIIFTNTTPILKDMPDSKAVYFSWYTFDKMLENAQGYECLQKRLIIVSTRAYVATSGLAVVEISTNDEEIGRRGAHLLLDHINQPQTKLGTLDIIIPKYCYRINERTAGERGVHFNKSVIKGAELL